MSLTLYHAPGSCSRASHIALREAGADFTLRTVDFATAEQRGAEPLRREDLSECETTWISQEPVDVLATCGRIRELAGRSGVQQLVVWR